MKMGWILLAVVTLVYMALYYFDASHIEVAMSSALDTAKLILPILLFVGLIMFFIEYFFDEKKLKQHLGRDRGIKAWIIALVGGILSHGPSYVWYPMLENLRDKGVRDSLVVVFLYARSIKIPWIPMMVVYFGWEFTSIFMIYILIGALVQGFLVSIFEKNK
jgi:uncharacterized membrane protein YraQ (UPF0718 family)